MPTRMEMMDTMLAAEQKPFSLRRVRKAMASATTELHDHPVRIIAAATTAAALAGCLAGFTLAWRASGHHHAAHLMVM